MLNIGSLIYRVNTKQISIGLIILIIHLFLWINVDWVFGTFAGQMQWVMLVYFILLMMSLIPFRPTQKQQIPTFQRRPIAIYNFLIAFIFTAVVVGLIAVLLPTGMLASMEVVKIAIGFGIIHGFVKAYIEEVVFRWILPVIAGLGDIASNVLFGLFHLGIASMMGIWLPWMAVIYLMGLGFIWSLVRGRAGKGLGILGSTGSHYAYNLIAMGVKVI